MSRLITSSLASAAQTRLVITGGGEPLLRADDVVRLVDRARRYFAEITCFTNGTYLTPELARRLGGAGLSYFCYSRHHEDGRPMPRADGADMRRLSKVLPRVGGLEGACHVCHGARYVDTPAAVERYMSSLSRFGVREFTFKHTYVAYEARYFGGSPTERMGRGEPGQSRSVYGPGHGDRAAAVGTVIRRLDEFQVCYYYEPDPAWEKEHRLCRSINLMSDGWAYASLEDHRSRLFRLSSS